MIAGGLILRPRRVGCCKSRSLTGRTTPVWRALPGEQLAHVGHLDEAIAKLDALITYLDAPSQTQADRLQATTRIDQRTVESLIARLGVDMAVVPPEYPCSSWTGLCFGNSEDAGKRNSGKARKESGWLQPTITLTVGTPPASSPT